ncbi:NAD-dependent epimerase/dehydratase family protein [Micromonospora sp. NPDC000663]|uniref:NAD-dependent epimerase/dehydratase family protein n=1 Tax=Micromonospora sp. NPDC000663 TaxID=3364218 RepID=UPI0036B938BC
MGKGVLLIGGSGFIGRHLLEACLQRGYEVTLLNRGRRATRYGVGVTHIVGDRRHLDRAVLSGLESGWDAVIDTCAYSAEDMSIGRCIPTRRYLLLSSCSVYGSVTGSQLTSERSPVDSSGPARGKLDCERLASELPAEVLVVRLGLVTGPGDPSGRLTYWVERCLRGESVLVPAEPDQPVQMIDVRDVAAFLAVAATSSLCGTVNVAGAVATFEETLRLVSDATRTAPSLRWVAGPVVLRHGVRPWREVPLWLPAGHPYRPHMRTNAGRARAAGLTLRPLAATVEDVTQWHRSDRTWHPEWLPTGRERAVLAEAG